MPCYVKSFFNRKPRVHVEAATEKNEKCPCFVMSSCDTYYVYALTEIFQLITTFCGWFFFSFVPSSLGGKYIFILKIL